MNPFHCTTSVSLIILFNLFPLPVIARDTITPTQPLLHNETLISSGGRFVLGFFTTPNSNNSYVGLWYNKITAHTILWVANRNNPITNSTTATLSITSDGSLAITEDHTSTIVWSTAAATSITDPVAQLLDTGNFVVKGETTATSDTESFSWQGFDHPTDTQLPEMKIGVDLISGLNRTLTSWKSNTDLSLGNYHLGMDISGDPELNLWGGSTKLWRSGPWGGVGFGGIADSPYYHDFFSLSFVDNKQEVTYSYHIKNQSTISRIVMDQSGVIQLLVWLEESSQWKVFFYEPRDQCDSFNACGPYGLCDASKTSTCSCLKGFRPKNTASWALRDATDGCVRITRLDCNTGTDGFLPVNNSKLPDTAKSVVYTNLTSLSECRNLCLSNCSCTAYARTNSSQGRIGCLIWATELNDVTLLTKGWAGQNFYLRLAGVELDVFAGVPYKAHKGVAFKMRVTLVVVILVLASLSGLGLHIWRRTKKKGHKGVHKEDDLELPLFDFAIISAATNNFSALNKLGEGGFGPVYKGKLGQDREIAVKRLAKTSVQGSDEFRTEVMLIAKLQHRNLVRLLGCCTERDERMLIYEYMPNKSLDAFLFEKEQAALLDWQTRYQIIFGIARGLLYLHQDSRFRIIHRDLKTNNILLDKEMNPKISDFGLARISREDDTETNTRRIVGTYGYMSPEYAMDGIFSVKSDVYSFGVVVLEIISGKKNRGAYAFSPDLNLVIHTWNLWNEGKSIEIVDESMRNSFPPMEVLKCIKIGLLCVQEWPQHRPSMSQVILMLGNDNAPSPQPREPGFILRSPSTSKKSTCNGLTLTTYEDGR